MHKLVLIRHGESTFNRAWRATPVDPLHFDAPLSETGHEQVRQARPTLADLPVEQPTRYELHVNATTAKALGIPIPAAIRANAEIVE